MWNRSLPLSDSQAPRQNKLCFNVRFSLHHYEPLKVFVLLMFLLLVFFAVRFIFIV